jgi:hypothetical protein
VQWRNQKLVEKRLAIYEDLAPLLNDNLCYFTYVGNWKERKPIEVIATKRIIDKKMYLAAPLFSHDFLRLMNDFQNHCFETYNAWGKDAKLRTKFERRTDAFGPSWDKAWANCFSDEASDPEKINVAYLEIMACFTREIGISDTPGPASLGQIPRNIR